MNRIIIALICMLMPLNLLAQVNGASQPQESAIAYANQRMESWRVNSFRNDFSLLQRSYISTSTAIEQIYSVNEMLDGSTWGAKSRISGGVWITPAQGVEVGISYGFLPNTEWKTDRLGNEYYVGKTDFSYGVDINYLFSLTSYAKRLLHPSKWEIIAKGGIDIREQIGVTLSLKAIYNFTSMAGIYIEPRYGLYTNMLNPCKNNPYIGTTISSIEAGIILRMNDRNFTATPPKGEMRDVVITSNLAYWALMMPNVGIEYRICDYLSIGVEGAFALVKSRAAYYSNQIISGDAELKYWFNKEAFRGHYVGSYVGGGKYDLDIEGVGNQGDFLSLGLSYGYVKSLSNSIAIELSLGWGYSSSDVKKYSSEGDCLVYKSSNRFTYDGVNKFTVGIIWSLFKGKN